MRGQEGGKNFIVGKGIVAIPPKSCQHWTDLLNACSSYILYQYQSLDAGIWQLQDVLVSRTSPDSSPSLTQSCSSGRRRTNLSIPRQPSWGLISCVEKDCTKTYKSSTSN